MNELEQIRQKIEERKKRHFESAKEHSVKGDSEESYESLCRGLELGIVLTLFPKE